MSRDRPNTSTTRKRLNPSRYSVPCATCLYLLLFLPVAVQAQSPEPIGGSAKKEPAGESTTEPSPDWPMERGDPQSTGAIASGIGDAFEIDWEFNYPKGAFESSPVVVTQEGKPTVFAAGIDANVKGKLFSIDLETGKPNWEFEIEEGFVSSPAWHDNQVYVGDMYGMVYCLDASSGERQWTFETQAEISSGGNFYQSLALFGSQDATLYALHQKTGKLQWSRAIDDQIQCGVSVVGDRCFLAGCDSKLHIIDLSKVNQEQEKENQAVEIASPTGCTAAAMGDSVFFGSEEGVFYSINYRDPKINWQWQDPAGATSIRSAAALTKERVVFGARNRRINCLNPRDGDLLWSTKVKAKVDGSPVIAGNRVYAGSTDGRFYVLDLADGNILWQKQFDGSIYGSAAIYGGEQPRLVLATERGTVYCLKPVAGAKRGTAPSVEEGR